MLRSSVTRRGRFNRHTRQDAKGAVSEPEDINIMRIEAKGVARKTEITENQKGTVHLTVLLAVAIPSHPSCIYYVASYFFCSLLAGLIPPLPVIAIFCHKKINPPTCPLQTTTVCQVFGRQFGMYLRSDHE